MTYVGVKCLTRHCSVLRDTRTRATAYNECIPLSLPKLMINNTIIKQETTMKFLGIMLEENLNWKAHIHYVEKKISKNLGILYKARYLLNKSYLKLIYFAFIHSYISYGSIVWTCTKKTKLATLLQRQKHASRIINFKDKYTHARP